MKGFNALLISILIKTSENFANRKSTMTITNVTQANAGVYTCKDSSPDVGQATLQVQTDCGALAKPANGNDITYSTAHVYQSVAVFTCVTGYQLSGTDSTRTRQADGSWSGTSPTCVKKSMTAGQVVCAALGSFALFAGGVVVIGYRCLMGYFPRCCRWRRRSGATGKASRGLMTRDLVQIPPDDYPEIEDTQIQDIFSEAKPSLKMSWNNHVEGLCAGPSVKMAGIFGKDGIKWATSADFEPTPREVQLLLALANGQKYNSNDQITVCGQKYVYVREPDEGLLSVLSRGGEEKYICSLGLTKTGAIITVALATDKGASRVHLDKYKEYLISIGY